MLRLLQTRLFEEGDGSDPAPAAPTPPAADPPAPSSNGGDQPGEVVEPDFAALVFDDDDDDGSEPAAPVLPDDSPAPAPATAQTPSAEPPAQAPAAPAQPAPAAAQPTGTPPAEPAQAAPAAQTPEEPLTPEKIEAAFADYEKGILPQLEKQYTLSEEQVDALNENPASVVPNLLAQVHYRAQISAYTGIMSQLPAIVGRVVQQFQKQSEATEQFYGAWPQLKDEKHSQTVTATLRAYRQANPKATLDEMIKKAGTMAMLSLGLDPNPPPAAPNGAAPPQQPARPAGTSGSGAPRPAEAGATDLWADIAEDIRNEGY